MADDFNENKLESMINKREESTFDIQLRHDGKNYTGWVIPSTQKNDSGKPKSYHVVLNEVFFGNLSFQNDTWEIDTQRENGLVQAVGEKIASTGN